MKSLQIHASCYLSPKVAHVINALNNLAVIPFAAYRFWIRSKQQKHYLTEIVGPLIDEAVAAMPDGSITPVDRNKIFTYYGWAVPVLLGEAFGVLRGKPVTQSDRLVLTCLGSLTGLFDDFFDEKRTAEAHILELINKPQIELAANAHEFLFIRLWRRALENVADPERLIFYLNDVYKAQIASKEQELPGLTPERIMEITREKGGISLLFYRCAFAEAIALEEYEMLMRLGGLGQLENDVFDIYKDYQAGINTLATTLPSVAEMRNVYELWLQETYLAISKLPYRKKYRRNFARITGLIAARGLVCLDFLAKAEATISANFSAAEFSREQLICDMDKPVNFLSQFNYYSRYRY